MKKIAILLVGIFLLSGCARVSNGVFKDSHVSFEIPEGWVLTMKGENEDVASLGKNTDVMAEKEAEGWVNYNFVQNDEGLTLQGYLTSEYNSCLEAFGPLEGSDFAPPCKEFIVSDLTNFKISGHDVYQSLWYGVPESGELHKSAYLVMEGEKNYFLKFVAVRTGLTDIGKIDEVFLNVLNTLELK